MNSVAVITRFAEHLDWIRYLDKSVNKIYIYNKGFNNNIFKNYVPEDPDKIIIIKRNNVGKHNHTIAKYIYDNYDELPDTLLFIPGTIMMGPRRGFFFSRINFNYPNIEKFSGFYSPTFKKVGKNFNYTKKDDSLDDSSFPDFKSWKNELIDKNPLFYTSLRGAFVVSKNNILSNSRDVYKNIMESTEESKNTINSYFAERVWAHLFKNYSPPTNE